MHNVDLATDYVQRAAVRVRAVQVLFEAESWADVVRESQEIVELALRGLLRSCGIDPPRVHNVSDVLVAERQRLPEALQSSVETLTDISRTLRRDCELAFYGTEGPHAFGLLLQEGRRARPARRDAHGRAGPSSRREGVMGLVTRKIRLRGGARRIGGDFGPGFFGQAARTNAARRMALTPGAPLGPTRRRFRAISAHSLAPRSLQASPRPRGCASPDSRQPAGPRESGR